MTPPAPLGWRGSSESRAACGTLKKHAQHIEEGQLQSLVEVPVDALGAEVLEPLDVPVNADTALQGTSTQLETLRERTDVRPTCSVGAGSRTHVESLEARGLETDLCGLPKEMHEQEVRGDKLQHCRCRATSMMTMRLL